MTTSAKPALSISSRTKASEPGPVTTWSTEVHDAKLKDMNFLTPREYEEQNKQTSVEQGRIDARRRNRNKNRLNRLKVKEAEYREQSDREISQSLRIKSFKSKADAMRDNVLDITGFLPEKSTPRKSGPTPIIPVPSDPVKTEFLSFHGSFQ